MHSIFQHRAGLHANLALVFNRFRCMKCYHFYCPRKLKTRFEFCCHNRMCCNSMKDVSHPNSPFFLALTSPSLSFFLHSFPSPSSFHLSLPTSPSYFPPSLRLPSLCLPSLPPSNHPKDTVRPPPWSCFSAAVPLWCRALLLRRWGKPCQTPATAVEDDA